MIRHSSPRLEFGALLILFVTLTSSLHQINAAPTVNHDTDLSTLEESDGCYYNYNHYSEGDRIMTNEPCLNCTCHNQMLMCYLRVCPFTKPIGQDCVVEKREDQCCPIITCPEVPVELEGHVAPGSTELGFPDTYGCTIDNKFYSEGSQVPSSPHKPCELCYCIRNMTTCVMQECTLHVDGCQPVYHRGVCCPVRYECDHDSDQPLMIEDEKTTTVRPTPGVTLPTTTLAPSTDCVHNGQLIADGGLVDTGKPCDHCYCMRGDIVCVVMKCMEPSTMDNCTAVPPKENECCPTDYICNGDIIKAEAFATTLAPEKTTLADEEDEDKLSATEATKTDAPSDTKTRLDLDDITTTAPEEERVTGKVDTHRRITHKPLEGEMVATTLAPEDEQVTQTEKSEVLKPEMDERTDKPKAEVPEEEEHATTMTSIDRTDKPSDEVEQQVTLKSDDQQKADESTDAPKEDVTTEATKVDVSTQAEKVDDLTHAPKAGETTVAPKDAESTEEPKSVEESTDAPKSDESTDAPKSEPESTDAVKEEKPTESPKVETESLTESPKAEEDSQVTEEPKKEEDLQKTTIAPEDRLSTFIPDMDKTTHKPESEDVSMDMNTVVPDMPSQEDTKSDLDRTTLKPEADATTEHLTHKPMFDEDDDKLAKTTLAPELEDTRETTLRPRFEEDKLEKDETKKEPEHVTEDLDLATEKVTTLAPASEDEDAQQFTTLKSLEPEDEDEEEHKHDVTFEPEEHKTEASLYTSTTLKPTTDDESMNEIPESMGDTMKEHATTVKPAGEDEAHTTIPSEDDELQKHIDEEDEVKVALPETTITPVTHETHKPEFDRGVLGEGDHTTLRPEDKLSTFIPDLEKTTTKPETDRDDLELPPGEIVTELPEMPDVTTMKLPEDEIIQPAKPVESDSHMMSEEDLTKTKPTEEESLEMNTVIPESATDKDVEQQTVGLDQDLLTTLAPVAVEKEDPLLAAIDKILTTLPPSKSDEAQYPGLDLPQAIPGEGDCLFDGQHFRHNSTIPSPDRCIICVCLNSAVRCNKTCDDIPFETTDKSEEAIVESSEVPAVVVEMTEPHSEEEVTAIVKEMYPTTEAPVEQDAQTTLSSKDEEPEQVTVDLGIKVDVPKEQATDKPLEQTTLQPEDVPKSDDTVTDASVTATPEKMTEKPLDATTVMADVELETVRPEDLPGGDELTTEKPKADEKEKDVSTDAPIIATEKTEMKEPETTELPVEEEKSTVRSQELPEDEDVATDRPTEHKETTDRQDDKLTTLKPEETTVSHVEHEKSTISPVMIHEKIDIEEDKQQTESPLESATASLPEQTTLHVEGMPEEEVQTHAPPSIESLEKVTEVPSEKTTLVPKVEEMTDKPEDETEKDVAATTLRVDEPEKMTESPVEKTTLAEEKPTEKPKVEEIATKVPVVAEKATEAPMDKEKATTMIPEMDKVTTVKDDESKADKDESVEKDQVTTALPSIHDDEKTTEQPKLEQTTLKLDEKPDHKLEEGQELQTTAQPSLEPEDKVTTPGTEVEVKQPELTTLAPGTEDETLKHDGTTLLPEKSEKEGTTMKPEMDLTEKATTALPSDIESTDKPEMKPETTDAPKEAEESTIRIEPVEQTEDQTKLDAAKPTETPLELSTQKSEEETQKPVDVAILVDQTTLKSTEPEATTQISGEPSDDSTTLRAELPTEAPSEADEEAGVTTTKVTLAPAKGHKKPVTEMIDGTMVEIVTPSSEIKTESPTPYEIVTPLSVEHELPGTTLASIDEEKEISKTTIAPEETKKDEPEQATEMIDLDKQTTLKPEDLEKESTSRPDDEKLEEKLTTLRPIVIETYTPSQEDDSKDKLTTLAPEEETKAEHDVTTLSPLKPEEKEKATTAQPSDDHTEVVTDKYEEKDVTTLSDVETTDAPKHDVAPETESSVTESSKDGETTDKPKHEEEETTEKEETMTEQPKLPAPEEIETKTELPYAPVTERLPEELTTILAQSGLDLTTMRIEHDHTLEEATTAKADDDEKATDAPKHDVQTDAPEHEMTTVGVKLPSEDKLDRTTLASIPEEEVEKATTSAPHEEEATEKDVVKAEEPEHVDATTESELSKTTLAPEHEIHEETMRPHVDEESKPVDTTTVKAEDEEKSEMEKTTTVAPTHEDADKTTLKPEGIDTKFGDEEKDDERHDEVSTGTTMQPTSSMEDSHEEDVQRPVDQFPSYPEEHTQKPPQPTYGTPAAPGFDPATFGQMPSGYPSSPDTYDEYEDNESDPSLFGPGTCRYGGKLYVSAQQIPRDDPCDFCFCFRSDIICLQQSCPPPINGCHEETIEGFCCPRYECPVSMATVVNITTSTTTTTTTLPPHFNRHAYKGATRAGCFIDGRTYQVGDVIERNTGPCMQCKCGADAQMECLPLNCSPEPMLRQMMEQHLMSSRRRR